MQTTYLKIMDGRARFDGRSSLKTWLFSVIRMTALENRRKKWVRSGLLSQWFEQDQALSEPPADTAQGTVERNEDRDLVLQALARLPARQREVLELVFYHDLTIAEASEAMKVSLGTARVHYDRGKKELKRLLALMRTKDG